MALDYLRYVNIYKLWLWIISTQVVLNVKYKVKW